MGPIGKLLAVAAIGAAALVSVTAAHAVEVLVSGSGVWGPTAPASDFSAPNETWSFSFELPNPIASNPTTQATEFCYFLNGVAVADPLINVQFFAPAQNGLFDLDFPGTSVSFYGADVGSNLTLALGVYPAQSALNDGGPTGAGTITLTAIPEPATWGLMVVGLAAAGFAARRRARTLSTPS